MQAKILVLNCGSSSLKFAVIEPISGDSLLMGLIERLNTSEAVLHWSFAAQKQQRPIADAGYQEALQAILELLAACALKDDIIGIGHRVVHGGERLTASTRITEQVLEEIRKCTSLAPLHNPANLQGISAAQQAFPQLPQIAVFDTAFHQTIPQHAYLYALPQKFYQRHAVRRYGFHGISYRYVTQQAIRQLALAAHDHGLLIAHLGNGCSAAAIVNGQSIDTSMGMTPLEGLMMGTRTGDIDPGLAAYLARECHYTLEEITDLFNKQAGLLGVSAISMDMRTLQQAAEQGSVDAQLAITMFCYRLAKYLGGLATTLPRLDALIFTGGIGENAALIRAQTLQQLRILNFAVDATHNQQHGRETNGVITQKNSTKALVIATNEELMIARDAWDLVNYA